MLPNSMEVDSDSKESNNNNNKTNGNQQEEKKEDNDNNEKLDRLNEIVIWKGKWNKKEYGVYFDNLTKIIDLKEQLEDETSVRKEKIKLVGMKFKKQFKSSNTKITDNTLVHHLECKSKKGFIMIGTLDKNAFKV